MKKYLGCCIPDCENNEGLIHLQVKHAEISGIFFCLEHVVEGHLLKSQLEAGKDLLILGINLDNVTNTAAPTRITQPPEKPIEPTDTWEWITDNNKWMNLQGKIVKISQLEDKELEDIVITIQETNIKRITKRINWITKLKEITTQPKYLYPQMNVDIEEAYAKLEEFYEVMVEKGLIPD